MLKEAISHIQTTTLPKIVEVGGYTFAVTSNGNAYQILPKIEHPEVLALNSLDALVKLVQTEGVNMETPLYITIPDPLTVRCFGRPNPDARYFRQCYYQVMVKDASGFREGIFVEYEKFIIALRSMFVHSEDVDYLLNLLSSVSNESGVTTSDNGVTQTVEARQGISLKALVPVKPRVSLRPYRTFQEVDQPESEFLVRLSNDGHIGLFEADGGMWKLQARKTIKAFLEKALEKQVSAGEVYIAL